MPDLIPAVSLPARHGPLDPAACIRADGLQVSPGPALDRLVLRGDRHAFALGFALPQSVGAATDHGSIAALCLGPDEWLLLGALGNTEIAALNSFDTPAGAAVDVGHRQCALLVGGPRAHDFLNAGCPLDLHPRAFAVGQCTRTLLGKAEIVLWHRAPQQFHLEVARSFAAYAWTFLAEAAPGMP